MLSELEIQLCAYGEHKDILRKQSIADEERQVVWETITK